MAMQRPDSGVDAQSKGHRRVLDASGTPMAEVAPHIHNAAGCHPMNQATKLAREINTIVQLDRSIRPNSGMATR